MQKLYRIALELLELWAIEYLASKRKPLNTAKILHFRKGLK